MENENPEDYRGLLFSVAYRMTGSVQEAEDIVQDVLTKYYSKAGKAPQEIKNLKNYLIRAATNEAVNRYHSLRKSRVEYPGVWLPEPLVESREHDGEIGYTHLRLSWLKLLEQLNPYERAVWILREVFEFDYEGVANFVDKSEAGCRQLLKRAKDKLRQNEGGINSSVSEEQYVKAFADAVQKGDFSRMKALFREDIQLYSDGGGKVNAARNPIIGNEHVFKFLQGIIMQNPGFTMQHVRINGQPGIVTYLGDEVDSVAVVDADEKGVRGIYIIRNPDKLSMAKHVGLGR